MPNFRRLLTTKVIKSHVKLNVKSDAQKVNSKVITKGGTTRVKNLHGIDFHVKFSMEFHGGLGNQLPWNSMEISP